MTIEEALEQVEMLKNKKLMRTTKYYKDVSEDLSSPSYRAHSKHAKILSREEQVRDTIGGFTDTMSMLLEDLANSKRNVNSQHLRDIQKKFRDLSKELDKKLTGLAFEY